ncbi:hypothetical protein ACJ2A9_04875 [Anaerobacillus sp. MEB173]|uniref:hypothetical protein n=1 Tax=Anaerobacillus sp. MEB173 TaxID=3383345 RepID=UPI003F931D6A
MPIVKERIGIRSTVRDNYLMFIVEGVVKELEEEKGLVLSATNPYHFMFVVDYSAWRYANRDSMDGMPRHLQFRLHNLILNGGVKDDI